MTLAEFNATLSDARAPGVGPLLRALWHDARGDWDEAHRLAQEIQTRDGAWVHAAVAVAYAQPLVVPQFTHL